MDGWMDGQMGRPRGSPKDFRKWGGRLGVLAGRLEVSKIVTHDFTTHSNLSMPQISSKN